MCRAFRRPGVDDEPIVLRIVNPYADNFSNYPSTVQTRQVNDQMDGQRDGLSGAPMRQADVRGQDAVREPRQGLLGGVRVDRRQTAEMPGVQRLQQVERFRASHLSDQYPVGTMPEG